MKEISEINKKINLGAAGGGGAMPQPVRPAQRALPPGYALAPGGGGLGGGMVNMLAPHMQQQQRPQP